MQGGTTLSRQDPGSVAGLDLGVSGCENAVEVGRGGFGVVYRAWQPAFSRTVAVKILAADRFDEASRARFERELKAMGRLSGHPNIVTVHQAGHTTLGNPYLLMAYEEGGSLAGRLKSGGVPWRDVLTGGIAVAGALETAHRAGVLHRDVKPENILISRYGEYKLADFGLARPRRAAAPNDGLRVTASVLHAAPEILRAEPATVVSDVYALGSTVFTWLAGRPAFAPADGEPVGDVLARIAASPVPDLRERGVPDPVCVAVERAMAKDPAARQSTAEIFAEELQRAQSASGAPVTELVLGIDDDAWAAWADEPAAAGTPRPPLTLSERARGALHLSATMAHRPVPRRRAGTRVLGATVIVVAALATCGSAYVPPPIPVNLTATVDFGDQELNAEPQERPVTLRNRGDRAVEVTSVALDGAHGRDFRISRDRCTGRSLQPSATCDVLLAFTPQNAGHRQAGLGLVLPGGVRTTALAGMALRRPAHKDDAPPGPCYADAYQVGRSAYGYVGGLKAISVKQYWSPSCRSAMAYVWIWKQYRDKAAPGGGNWTVDLAARGERPGEEKRERANGQPVELWTEPIRLAGGCAVTTATLVTAGPAKSTVTATTARHCG